MHNLTAYGDVAKEAQRKLAAHDPVALRSAYARLFEAVVVGDEDAKGNRRLDFVLREPSRPGGFRPLTPHRT